MSKRARMTYLQEKLKEARDKSREGTIYLAIGAIFIVLYIFFSLIESYDPWIIAILILGLFMLASGIAVKRYWDSQKKRITEELAKMATKIPS